MNILLVSHRFYHDSKAGTEVLVEDTAYELKRRGHNVMIMAVGSDMQQEEYKIRSRDDGIICISLSAVRQRHMLDGWKTMETVQQRKIERAIRTLNTNFDVLHIFHFVRIGLSFYTLPCFRKSRLFVTLTDYSLFCPDYQLFNRKAGCICKQPDHMEECISCLDDTVSTDEIWVWRKYNLDFINKHVTAVFNQTKVQMQINRSIGLKADVLSAMCVSYKTPSNWIQIEREKDNCFEFAFMGRISPEKGLHVLLQAFQKQEFSDTRFLVCGDYDSDEEYGLKIQKEMNRCNNIVYKPAVPIEELGILLSSVNSVLFPALWNENRSVLLTNTCAMGIPAICSAVPSLCELTFPQLRFVQSYTSVDAWVQAMRIQLAESMSLPRLPCAENFMAVQHEFYTYMDHLERMYYSP